jgi:NO-binding membrane sensor protein with MHYT domain
VLTGVELGVPKNYSFLAPLYIVLYAIVGAVLGLVVGRFGPTGLLPTVVATAVTLGLAWLAQVLLDFDPKGALAVLILAALTFPAAYWLAPRRRTRHGYTPPPSRL